MELICSVAEFARRHNLPYMTVKNHMKRGWCAWPRRILDGVTANPAYKCWENMVQRATNINNNKSQHYYNRGIDIYPPWISNFRLFLDHIGPRPSSRHSIDRIDNNKGYWPGNVRWATAVEQRHNQRTAPKNKGYGVQKHGRYYRFSTKGQTYKFKTLEEARQAYETHHNTRGNW